MKLFFILVYIFFLLSCAHNNLKNEKLREPSSSKLNLKVIHFGGSDTTNELERGDYDGISKPMMEAFESKRGNLVLKSGDKKIIVPNSQGLLETINMASEINNNFNSEVYTYRGDRFGHIGSQWRIKTGDEDYPVDRIDVSVDYYTGKRQYALQIYRSNCMPWGSENPNPCKIFPRGEELLNNKYSSIHDLREKLISELLKRK